jgi:hypothetical protein
MPKLARRATLIALLAVGLALPAHARPTPEVHDVPGTYGTSSGGGRSVAWGEWVQDTERPAGLFAYSILNGWPNKYTGTR